MVCLSLTHLTLSKYNIHGLFTQSSGHQLWKLQEKTVKSEPCIQTRLLLYMLFIS